MKATFLVEIETGADTNFLQVAEDMKEELLLAGFDVLSSKPWQRDALALTQLPQQPPPLQQPS